MGAANFTSDLPYTATAKLLWRGNTARHPAMSKWIPRRPWRHDYDRQLDQPSPRALRSKIKVILELVLSDFGIVLSLKGPYLKKPSYIIYYKNLFEELGSVLMS